MAERISSKGVKPQTAPATAESPITVSPTVQVLAATGFQPSQLQREIKARFWARAKDNPLVDPASLSHQQAALIAQHTSLPQWLSSPEFAAWFFNKDSARHRLEAGVEVAIERLVEIVRSRDVGPKGEVTAASQVNAAKLLLEFAGYAPPSRKEVIFKDKDILEMDEQKLRAFIDTSVRQLPEGDN